MRNLGFTISASGNAPTASQTSLSNLKQLSSHQSDRAFEQTKKAMGSQSKPAQVKSGKKK